GAWTESPTISSSRYPSGIVAAASGTVWITTLPGSGGSAVKIPATGASAEVPLTLYSPGDPAIDASGNLWYADSAGVIGRLDVHGKIKTFTVPTEGAYPIGVAVAPDGKIWFTESKAGKIGRLDPAA